MDCLLGPNHLVYEPLQYCRRDFDRAGQWIPEKLLHFRICRVYIHDRRFCDILYNSDHQRPSLGVPVSSKRIFTTSRDSKVHHDFHLRKAADQIPILCHEGTPVQFNGILYQQKLVPDQRPCSNVCYCFDIIHIGRGQFIRGKYLEPYSKELGNKIAWWRRAAQGRAHDEF